MARATWSGSISFGLVTVPVKVFTAARSHDVRFTQLHRETQNRVRQRRVDEETGEEVSYADIVKGYEVAPDQYVVVDPDELAELDPDASRLVDIRDFVGLDEIDPVYYDRPYYLMPDGEAAGKPYRLLVEAMSRQGKVAIATMVMRGKQYLVAIRPADDLLVMSTMRFADEVVDPADLDAPDVLSDVEVSDREVAMAEQLIEQLVTEFDPTAYEDTHQQRVVEFLEAKASGQTVDLTPPERDTGGVIDLMSALEQSLERASGERGGGSAGAGAADDLESMSKDELYDLAQARDLPGRSSMTKAELVAALRDHDEPLAAAS